LQKRSNASLKYRIVSSCRQQRTDTPRPLSPLPPSRERPSRERPRRRAANKSYEFAPLHCLTPAEHEAIVTR
jgi:hypothetical protein